MTAIQLDRAIQAVRSRALLFMTSTVQIRKAVKPTFDINTGRAASGSGALVYEGLARIWEVTQGGSVVVGEDDVNLENTQLSIPWNISPVPQKGDLVKVLTSDDANLVGRVFAIRSAAKSGLLRPTRRFNVTLHEESRDV